MILAFCTPYVTIRLKTLFVSHRWRNVWMYLSNIKAANVAIRLRYPSWHTREYRVQNRSVSLLTGDLWVRNISARTPSRGDTQQLRTAQKLSWILAQIGMISQETVLLKKCLTLTIFGQFWLISSSEPLDEYGPSLYLCVSFIETHMCVCRSPPWFLFCCSNWGKKRIQARLMLCWTACQTSGLTRYWAPLASTVLLYNEFTSLQSNYHLLKLFLFETNSYSECEKLCICRGLFLTSVRICMIILTINTPCALNVPALCPHGAADSPHAGQCAQAESSGNASHDCSLEETGLQ